MQSGTRADTLAFQVDLWSARGRFPATLTDVATRQKEIQFSSRTRANTDQFKQLQELRHALAHLLDKLPPDLRRSEEARLLGRVADYKVYNLVHLIYRSRAYEGDFEGLRILAPQHAGALAVGLRGRGACPVTSGDLHEAAEPGRAAGLRFRRGIATDRRTGCRRLEGLSRSARQARGAGVMKLEDVVKNAFAMPLTSPAYPPGPYRFIDREFFIITYRTDPQKLRAVVPEPLEIDEPLVKYEFIRMPDSTGFGDYTETGQVIPVRFEGRRGSYTHCMFLDDHPPIAGGRELWGFPKKLASPSLRAEIDTLVGTLDYGPVRVATGTMGYKHRSADLQAVRASLMQPNFLLKIIPHVDGTPRICELVEYYLEDVTVKGAWTGPAALSLNPHALAPVAELPVLEVVSALHLVADLTLGLGRVAYDYLA